MRYPSFTRLADRSVELYRHTHDCLGEGRYVPVSDDQKIYTFEEMTAACEAAHRPPRPLHHRAAPGVPLQPRTLRPSQPFCMGCLRLQDDCHCAPTLNQDGSLRVNASAPVPRVVPILGCKHCGHARCRCAVAAPPDTLRLVVEQQRARGQRA